MRTTDALREDVENKLMRVGELVREGESARYTLNGIRISIRCKNSERNASKPQRFDVSKNEFTIGTKFFIYCIGCADDLWIIPAKVLSDCVQEASVNQRFPERKLFRIDIRRGEILPVGSSKRFDVKKYKNNLEPLTTKP